MKKIENGMVIIPVDEYNVEQQITLLRGMFTGFRDVFPLSLDALSLAVRCHKGQYREGGKPYIAHPLSMACMAKGLGLRDDALYATILLHDVCEDCGLKIQEISESSQVRNAVRLMTVMQYSYDQTKADVKRRYFEDLLQSREALICKALDRIDNLESMAGVFERERVLKNWRETYHLLMPTLKRAKEMFNMRDYDLLHILRGRIRSALVSIMHLYQFTDEEMYTPYGHMSFEQKPVHSADYKLENELEEFREAQYSRAVIDVGAISRVPKDAPLKTADAGGTPKLDSSPIV